MTALIKLLLLIPLAALAINSSAPAVTQKANSNSGGPSKSRYDPGRDPDKDLQDALREAGGTGKRILLDVGGEWCGWCHQLDAFFEEHPNLLKLRETGFIFLKINVSSENLNKKFLSHYPDIPGYPHFFVVDSNGKLLQSQGTSELERGSSYDADKLEAFLMKWTPAGVRAN